MSGTNAGVTITVGILDRRIAQVFYETDTARACFTDRTKLHLIESVLGDLVELFSQLQPDTLEPRRVFNVGQSGTSPNFP